MSETNRSCTSSISAAAGIFYLIFFGAFAFAALLWIARIGSGYYPDWALHASAIMFAVALVIAIKTSYAKALGLGLVLPVVAFLMVGVATILDPLAGSNVPGAKEMHNLANNLFQLVSTAALLIGGAIAVIGPLLPERMR